MAVKNNYPMITGFENLNLQGTIGTLPPSEGLKRSVIDIHELSYQHGYCLLHGICEDF